MLTTQHREDGGLMSTPWYKEKFLDKTQDLTVLYWKYGALERPPVMDHR